MPNVSKEAREIAATIRTSMSAQVSAMARSYFDSGDYRSGGGKWRGGISGDGRSYTVDHYRMRQNARNSYHGDTIGRAIVERYAETSAGTGLVCEASPTYKILGISLDDAETWGRDVDERYDLWMHSKECHRSEILTGYQSQRLYVIGQQRDGDNFIRLYYSNDRELMNPLQFEFLDPGQINGDAYTTTRVYMRSDDGIIRDSRGRETAYKVRVKRKISETQVKWETVTVPAKGRGSGRRMMLHGYAPEYAGQGRGYSRLGHALQEMQKLTSFTLAQIMKAINQSLFFMFVKPGQDAPASNALEDLSNLDGGTFVNAYGSQPTAPEGARGVTDQSLSPVNHYGIPYGDVGEPGSMAVFSLNRGEDLKGFVNTAPSESYDKFVDSFSAYLAASTGVPLEVVLMRFNRNYTASRGALIMFWQNAVIWRREMISDFLNPLREAWMAEEVAAGRIAAPGWSDPVLRSAWLKCNWHGAPLPDTDPVKTATANHMNAKIGAKTLDTISREHGGDGSRNRAKLNREIEELAVWPFSSARDPK